jgi:hypothetical protein
VNQSSEDQDVPRSREQESGSRDWDGPVTVAEAAQKRAGQVAKRSTPADRQTR